MYIIHIYKRSIIYISGLSPYIHVQTILLSLLRYHSMFLAIYTVVATLLLLILFNNSYDLTAVFFEGRFRVRFWSTLPSPSNISSKYVLVQELLLM